MAQMPVKPLIRLVDDEVDQLAALEMLLVGQGWDVASYTGAKEFLTSDSLRGKSGSGDIVGLPVQAIFAIEDTFIGHQYLK